MFAYTIEQYSAQAASQPIFLQLWLNWLIFVNSLPALFFLRHIQARYVLAAVVLVMVFNIPLALTFGFSKALALPHLVFWGGLVYYLINQWKNNLIAPSVWLRSWLAALMITNIISLVFDVRDSWLFLLGDHEIIKASTNEVPYISFAFIVAILIGLFIYLRKPNNSDIN